MFVGFSQGLRRMGGFRIGAGLRLTRRNAMFMIWLLFFVAIIWLMWKMILLAGWGLYFMLYGLYLCYKYLFLGAFWCVKKVFALITGRKDEAPPADESMQ